jgi:hypothetical protein
MAKKRNAGKLRPQSYPDSEDFDYSRDKEQAVEEPMRPAKVQVDYAAESRYCEGQLVTIAQLQVIGTVVQCVGKDLLVLDAPGIVHRVKEHEVYPLQNNS